MTNTCYHAQMELDILSAAATDPENRPIIEPFREEILALCEKFGNSGQSGGSAPYTANAISSAVKKLFLQEPISPITGIDQEWMLVSEKGESKLYQNIRCSAVFKNETGKAWYLDAIVKKTQNNSTWTGSFWLSKDDYIQQNPNAKISSKQYIKSFPFTPKTFYIDVIEEEVAKDDWEMYAKDTQQLEKVWKYYDRMEREPKA